MNSTFKAAIHANVKSAFACNRRNPDPNYGHLPVFGGENGPLRGRFRQRRMLLRRAQGQRQGVQAAGELAVQQRMHGARAGHPGLPAEGVADQQHAVMRLPARPRARMAGMAVAVIGHAQHGGGEMLAQQGFDTVGAGCHAASMAGETRRCKSPLCKRAATPHIAG